MIPVRKALPGIIIGGAVVFLVCALIISWYVWDVQYIKARPWVFVAEIVLCGVLAGLSRTFIVLIRGIPMNIQYVYNVVLRFFIFGALHVLAQFTGLMQIQ